MDSVNKYGSDGVLFNGNIAEIKPPEQQIQQMIDALVPFVQAVIDAIVPIIEPFVDSIAQIWEAILKSYPDKRVVWLAFNHPKARIRKKNRHRISKYIASEVNHHGHDW